ncbi:MAG: hypothetical protein L0Y75_09680 [Acidobacteria bacterium]|nr:hypothetical protein [Acidobacteriota bacterium]
MTVGIKPLAEITHEALGILFKSLGIANTMRFISQFTTGYGNYTEERRTIFADMSVDDIVAEIEKDRKQS